MKYFSRKLVAILVLIIWLSTLGIKYAKADFSNVITKSLGLNGYYKFPDGLLIQWGYSSSGSYNKTVYLNTSFIDTNYCVQITTVIPGDSLASAMIYSLNKTKSSFVCRSRYIGASLEGISDCPDPFYWFAIGRYK